jgi:ribosomal protein S12 methylthiotransferase
MGFVRAVEFDRVGVFTYSDEEDTHGATLGSKVDETIAMRRRRQLMKEQARISLRKNKKRVGSIERVLFEGESAETDLLWQGRTQSQAPEVDGCVLINDAPEDYPLPAPGDFVNVRITEAHEHDLVGAII